MSEASPQGETASSSLPPPSSPPSPSSSSSPRRRAALSAVSLVTAGALLLVLALIATAPYWAPQVIPVLPWGAAAAESQKAAEARQRATEQRLAAIEQQLGTLTTLNDRVAALEQRPQPADASAAIASLNDAMQQLSTRLDRIDDRLTALAKEQASSAESPERVLMLALAGLGDTLASSAPYAAQLTSVEAMSQNRPGWAAALKPLEGAAQSGIPSLAVLTQQFRAQVVPAIQEAESAGQAPPQNLWQAVLARLRALITIRRIDETGAGISPTDRAVATATAALTKGDLAGAVAALRGLTGAPAQAAAGWITAAQQRLQADETVAKLSAELANDLASGKGG